MLYFPRAKSKGLKSRTKRKLHFRLVDKRIFRSWQIFSFLRFQIPVTTFFLRSPISCPIFGFFKFLIAMEENGKVLYFPRAKSKGLKSRTKRKLHFRLVDKRIFRSWQIFSFLRFQIPVTTFFLRSPISFCHYLILFSFFPFRV